MCAIHLEVEARLEELIIFASSTGLAHQGWE